MRARDVFGQMAGRLLGPMPRDGRAELMDASAEIGDAAELDANFRDIERVNRLLGGTATVLRHLPALLATVPAGRPATILDIATGSADIPLAIARWARRRGRPVAITASDVSDEILAVARRRVGGGTEITLARYDARAVPLPDGAFDIVVCSLALHHFGPEDAVRILREMARLSSEGFILNDLRRGRLGFAAAWVAARCTTRNRLTRNDAPLSVRRAYTVPEIADLLRRAEITGATVTTHPWFRMAVVWRRSAAPDGVAGAADRDGERHG